MPNEFDEQVEKQTEEERLAEQEALEEQAQAEREEKIFQTLRGCNMILVVGITIVIVLILLYVNFFLD